MIGPHPDNAAQSILNPNDYYMGIKIPESWNTLEDFFNWFILDAKMPLMIPWNANIIRGDDFTAISIFRRGQYQVELYLEHPALYIRPHCHPNVETITMQLGGGEQFPSQENYNMSTRWGTIDWKRPAGLMHGDDPSGERFAGCCLLSFQKWIHNEPVTSVATHWKGTTSGMLHDSIIREQYPAMFVQNGYADVSMSIEEHDAIQSVMSGNN
jgi:hypothetical protein